MNYSTLKKTAALSIVSLMAIGAANAQTSSDSTKAATSSAKIFGGSGQYRTWNIGVNIGVTSPYLPFGNNNFDNPTLEFGYGVSVRKQVAHSFGLQLDVVGYGTSVAGSNDKPKNGIGSFKTTIAWQAALSGKVNVATVDYLRRKNAINFYVSAGAGLVAFNQKVYKDAASNNLLVDGKTARGASYAQEMVMPVGVGAAFRLSDRMSLDLGYTGNFIDGISFDGTDSYGNSDRKSKYSYAYAGLDFSLGSVAKPNLDWVNPVAMMYDELNDPTLKQEVEALKARVSNVEKAVDDLKKDSDGDGVADQFDKCPNTPAGTVVDGSGCPLKLQNVDTSLFVRKGQEAAHISGTAYSNIQFEFDSSVLRTSSYPVLDATSADLRATGATVWVNGYASSEGTAAHNMQLSKDRANSVKTYLVNSGVDAKKLKVKGYGEEKPIADNSTEEGRVLNRRVQFKK